MSTLPPPPSGDSSGSNTPEWSSPPPPAVGGGGQPPAVPPPVPSSSGEYSVSKAFNFGWLKFQENLGPILMGTVLLVGAGLLIGILYFVVVGSIAQVGGDSDAGVAGILVSTALFGLALVALLYIIQAGIIRAAFAIVDGRPIEMSTLLGTRHLGAVIIGSLLVSLFASIGFFLLIVPGIVVLFFTQFFLFFIIGEDMAAIDGIKASFSFVNAHIADVVVLFIAVYIANTIGSLVCLIGLLVSFPVTVIAQAWAFRKLRATPRAA